MRARLLTPADANRYVELRREMLLEAPWAFMATPDHDLGCDALAVASALGEAENLIVAVDDEAGRLLAAAGVIRSRREKTRHRATIWGVYTTPAHRRRGLAGEVTRAAIEAARAWPGVTLIGLSVSERAAEAQRLYAQLGFRTWGVEPEALCVDGRAYAEHHMALSIGGRISCRE
jgi:ribosomal protein S18 acetylase RimI-like enzyme